MNQYAYKQPQLNLQNGHHQQQLTPIQNLSTQPYQPDTPGPPQILPPLFTQQPSTSYHNGPGRPYSAGTHTPHTSHTPTASASANHSNGPQQQNGTLPSIMGNQSHPGYAPIVPAYHGLAQQSLPSIGGSGPSNGHANSQPNGQPSSSLPNISPNAYPGDGRQIPMPSYAGPPQLLSQAHNTSNSDNRFLPVVGTQGRRGILPSAPGRAPASASLDTGGRPGATQAPVKNAEGKYPCQYCNKTYLHAKHLKRHNLRHTGERPYQCSLCNETFCRSDILKRHFQKCAVRRGNPSGANHLTHAQAHLRASQSGSASNGYPTAPNSVSGESPTVNGQWRNQLPNNSARSSRASSIIRPSSSGSEEKKRYTQNALVSASVGLDPNATTSQAPGHLDRNYSNYSIPPDRLTSQTYQDSQPPPYSSAPPSNSYPMTSHHEHPPSSMVYSQGGNYNQYGGPQSNQVNGDSWHSYFQPGAQDAMMFSQ